jgi:hypothetical protein
MLGYQKNRGLRIDHILVSDALRPLVKACASTACRANGNEARATMRRWTSNSRPEPDSGTGQAPSRPTSPRGVKVAVSGGRGARGACLLQAEFLDLARDGVAADAQLLRRLDAAAPRVGQRGVDEFRLEALGQLVPHIGRPVASSSSASASRPGFPATMEAGRGGLPHGQPAAR